ncbi:hypothetical protein SynMITS9220M01_126 [Synechococcus phage SynMITS9220M01]|nr:hypothetical protein SynMITS9220M01_126 [Synechococcus phage SynMITS9220M01]
MTLNAWSMLYDELLKMDKQDSIDHSEYYYHYDRNDLTRENPFSDENTFNITMTENRRYKYSEDAILKELNDYIAGTYNQHYSAGDDKIQTLDLIEACGDGEAFCRSNILKYASRYDKKGTARRDIMKILHYAVLLMHFNDKNAKRETYPQ